MKPLNLLLSCFVCTVFSASYGATYYAASVERADIVAALGECVDGDTLVLPPGASTITPTITLDKAVTVLGSGNGTGAGDTILSAASDSSVFNVLPVANKNTRISLIRFDGGSFAITGTGNNTDGSRLRIDHCVFVDFVTWALNLVTVLGVCDHCSFLPTTAHPAFVGYRWDMGWDGQSYGDGSLSATSGFGTDKFWFFEDCVMTNPDTSLSITVIDGQGGSRYVLRKSTMTRAHPSWHGTESGGRIRAGRAVEIYNNNFIGSPDGTIEVTYFRSGVGRIHGNRFSGYSSGPVLTLLNFRAVDPFGPFSAGRIEGQLADGTNPWDVNVPSGPFYTGTTSDSDSGGGVFRTVTVSGASWETDQWKKYSVMRTSGASISSMTRSGSTVTVVCASHGFVNGDWVSIRGANESAYNGSVSVTVVDSNTFTYDFGYTEATLPASPATGTMYCFSGNPVSEIVSNTTDTITYYTSVYGVGHRLRFDAGSTLAFYKVQHAMDQPGRSGGSLLGLSGSPSLPVGWNDQATDPWYGWSNGGVGFVVKFGSVREDEHYFNEAESFNGSTGMGVGTRSQMDAITPTLLNVGFWVTDEGEWDSTHAGADGRLYRWNGSAWVLDYTPYAYPHPLIAQTDGNQVAMPGFSPAAGIYDATQTVTISTATSGATIYYTTNGDTPTTGSTLYSGPVTVTASTTPVVLKALAVKAELTDSPVMSGTYTFQAATPSFSPAAGSYGSAQSVTITSSTSGATIHYTTNGDTPTSGSSTYSTPVSIPSTTTLKAITIKSGISDSAVRSGTYTISGGGGAGTLNIGTLNVTNIQ